MATSGNTTFTTTRNKIIRAAALEVSAIGTGQIMSAEMVNDFAFKLNAMVKHWQGRGIKIWTVRDATLFPVPGQTRYGAGTGATDHITETWYQTTLSAAEASGQTVISLTSTANITTGDYLGIMLDSGTLHWSTVSSKTSTTATIASATTGAAASGNRVFSYTSNIPKPVRVVAARSYDIASAIDIPIDLMSHQEYRDLPQKTQAGAINQVQYDPQRVVGYFNLWSVPSTVTNLLRFTYWRPIETFEAGGDNPDLPEEWVNCLIWNLAYEMMGRFPVSPTRSSLIRDRAQETLFDMEGFGREAESLYFQPDYGP